MYGGAAFALTQTSSYTVGIGRDSFSSFYAHGDGPMSSYYQQWNMRILHISSGVMGATFGELGVEDQLEMGHHKRRAIGGPRIFYVPTVPY